MTNQSKQLEDAKETLRWWEKGVWSWGQEDEDGTLMVHLPTIMTAFTKVIAAQALVTEARVRQETIEAVKQLKKDLKVSAGLDKVLKLLSNNPNNNEKK